MTIKSIPPASSHFAEIPVPAPPPMMGSPFSIFSRKRDNISERVFCHVALSHFHPLLPPHHYSGVEH